MSEPTKEAMDFARRVAFDLGDMTASDPRVTVIALAFDAAHARIREQAKAWRAQWAVRELEPIVRDEDGDDFYVEWMDEHFEYSERTGMHPTVEAAMIAAAEAALGADWDA